jgi:adenylate cyclase
MTATGLGCASCGAELRAGDKFCHECAAPVVAPATSAEYKQVTVLFADVVHSMKIAAAVGAERLREIMTELVERSAAVVKRCGGTVDKFTGDGIMAVFGAPVALEDHALRACLAALGVQDEAKQLAVSVHDRDGVKLRLRVGLNSGQVIAGEIGSGPFGYTAVGEQVGMAQRMESVAPPGGVMLGESTARLVRHAALLSEAQRVRIKGATAPVTAFRLLRLDSHHDLVSVEATSLIGRRSEVAALEAILERAIAGQGGVVSIVGLAGIGKSRLVRELAAMAANRGVEIFGTFCESHTSEIPFHTIARLLRSVVGVNSLDNEAARARVRIRMPDADPEDLLLLDDMLGIADLDAPLPRIDPDARRRRLTALFNSAQLARTDPALFIVEDAHWIDEVSESMVQDLLSVMPQTPSMMVSTYRPEYQGPVAHISGAQTIALTPLNDSESAALIAELLGSDPSVAELAKSIADRAAGNPFFTEEIVRDLTERGVLQGNRGAFVRGVDAADMSVPATLQAAISARIDRVQAVAKRALNAAAVIGSRFTTDLLTTLGIEPVVDELVRAQLVDQIRFTPHAGYAFRHPLIRTVAYESQLKSDRAELHRGLAAAIEQRNPESVDENAALIGEHLEAAGDLHAAHGWHMRAASWAINRDITAAKVSWQRARQVADRLPGDNPDRTSLRIAPRTMLCGTAWLWSGSIADTGFDELQDLAATAGDKVSLAIGMSGLLMTLTLYRRHRESSRLASECIGLLDSIGDPTLTVGLSWAAMSAKFFAGEAAEALRLAQRAIDLADGDPTKGDLLGVGSPLALAIDCRGSARWALGLVGWRDDFDQAIAMAGAVDPRLKVRLIADFYTLAPVNGAVLPDTTALRTTAEALAIAERSGDDSALLSARGARGIVLAHQRGPAREQGLDLLAQLREAVLQQPITLVEVSVIDIQTAKERARTGDLDGAIELSRAVINELFASGLMIYRGPATTVLVETLLRRNADGDQVEAQAAIDRLAAVPTDRGFVLHELPLLRMRALLARARGDEDAYRDHRDRYRAMATSLGFEGHIRWAEAMP